MTVTHVPPRLTRVVIDHDCGVEIAQLQRLTERIHDMLPQAAPVERDYIANALLNLALRALEQRGSMPLMR